MTSTDWTETIRRRLNREIRTLLRDEYADPESFMIKSSRGSRWPGCPRKATLYAVYLHPVTVTVGSLESLEDLVRDGLVLTPGMWGTPKERRDLANCNFIVRRKGYDRDS